jgi:hypothetical protein
MSDRSQGRGQTKFSPWSSKLGVGYGANNCYDTSREPTRGPCRKPIPTQGCSASKQKKTKANIPVGYMHLAGGTAGVTTENEMADWVNVKFLRRSEPQRVGRGRGGGSVLLEAPSK